MNQKRCGIDIVEIKRFKKLMARSDKDQLQTLFTVEEWSYCQQKPQPLLSLAARFAVKEACLKLFPHETNRLELDFIDIEVLMDNEGAPYIKKNDKVNKLLIRYNVSNICVSISHTQNYACGIAIME